MSANEFPVVCWYWGQRYQVGHINALRRMLERRLPIPHRLICVADRFPTGIDPRIRVIRHRAVVAPRWGCWRRLWAFSREFGALVGTRHLSIDLDVVITGDLSTIVDRPEEFVVSRGWAPDHPDNPYSGTLWLMNSGCHEEVWTRWRDAYYGRGGDVRRIHRELHGRGLNGTDSAWIGHVLGPGVPTWTRRDGITSFPFDVQAQGRVTYPKGSRIVLFHGRQNDPADPLLQKQHPWIRRHYGWTRD